MRLRNSQMGRDIEEYVSAFRSGMLAVYRINASGASAFTIFRRDFLNGKEARSDNAARV